MTLVNGDGYERPPEVLAAGPRLGIPIVAESSMVIMSLGSTAMVVLNDLRQRVFAELGGTAPEVLQFVAIDTAGPPEGIDPLLVHRIGDGTHVDGVGTDPVLGRRIYDEDPSSLREIMVNAFSRLKGVHPRLRSGRPPQEATRLVLMASQGGTAGGLLKPTIDEACRAARQLGHGGLRITPVLVGPDILLDSVERVQYEHLRCWLPATFYQNLAVLYRDLARADGGAGDALREIIIADKLNLGHHAATTVGEFLAMLGRALFFRFFTPAGKFVDDRYADFLGTGNVRGRARGERQGRE